jgi:dTDP-4-dehydrorhamnose reductase
MLLVLGKSGQLAQTLARRNLPDSQYAGRDDIDLARPERVYDAILARKPSAIINAAAFTNVELAETEGEMSFRVNALSVAEVARACVKLGIPLVHVSTDYVFSGSANVPYREDDATGPINIYGASKLAGEEHILSSGANAAIIRTSWLYSEFGTNFVTKMLTLARQGTCPNVVDDQIGSPTYAADLADACIFVLAALSGRENAAGIYHFANDGAASWADLAAEVFDIHGHATGKQMRISRVKSDAYPQRAKRPMRSILDTTKIRTLGLEIRDWKKSLQVCVGNLLV